VKIIVLAAAVIVALAIVALQSFPAVAKTLRWNCVYTVVAQPEGVSKGEFKLEFVADDITGKTVLVGACRTSIRTLGRTA
jgi:hypothetical protein